MCDNAEAGRVARGRAGDTGPEGQAGVRYGGFHRPCQGFILRAVESQ